MEWARSLSFPVEAASILGCRSRNWARTLKEKWTDCFWYLYSHFAPLDVSLFFSFISSPAHHFVWISFWVPRPSGEHNCQYFSKWPFVRFDFLQQTSDFWSWSSNRHIHSFCRGAHPYEPITDLCSGGVRLCFPRRVSAADRSQFKIEWDAPRNRFWTFILFNGLYCDANRRFIWSPWSFKMVARQWDGATLMVKRPPYTYPLPFQTSCDWKEATKTHWPRGATIWAGKLM